MPDRGLSPIFAGYKDDSDFPYIGLSDEALALKRELHRQDMEQYTLKTPEQKRDELRARIEERVSKFRPQQS